jgi:DNA-directed RNA polymerase sigma subunit (sigma70/sigma32)
MLEARRAGLTLTQIGERYELSRQRIAQLLEGRR